MDILSLEQIEEIVLTYDFDRDSSMNCAGLCDKDSSKIFYNPFEIPSEREFYITLLHEMVHAVDPNDDCPEDDIEDAAVRSYEDEDILTYVKEVFPYSLCRA